MQKVESVVEGYDLVIKILQPGANVGWGYNGGPIAFYYEANKPLSWVAYGLVQLPEFSNGLYVLIVNVGFYNNFHYTGSYVHTIYFAINASKVISNPTPASTQSPTPCPTVQDFSSLTIPLLLSVILVTLLVFWVALRNTIKRI